MSTIHSTEKSQTRYNKEILINLDQEYQRNTIFKDTSVIQIIAAFYLVFKMFRKIKMNLDVNLRISAENPKKVLKKQKKMDY